VCESDGDNTSAPCLTDQAIVGVRARWQHVLAGCAPRWERVTWLRLPSSRHESTTARERNQKRAAFHGTKSIGIVYQSLLSNRSVDYHSYNSR
jgi:hypothetical protein